MKANWMKRIIPRVGMLAIVLAALIIPLINFTPVSAADGDTYYWVGGSGNWTDFGSHWATTSGGAVFHGAAPNATNPVVFDNVSFTAPGQTVTVNAAASCLDMTWTGAANTPGFAMTAAALSVYGSVTFIAAMTPTGAYSFTFVGTGVANTLTTNGLTLPFTMVVGYGADNGKVTLQDALTFSQQMVFTRGVLDTNGQTVAQTGGSGINISGANAKTLTMGASAITCTAFNYSGSSLTVTANTATINVTGTGAVALGTANWNGASFNLNGTAHTVSGSPTGIAVFTRNGTATLTDSVTLTSGTTLTCTTFAMKGNSAVNRLLVKTTVAGTSANVTATNWTGSRSINVKDIRAVNAVDLSAITGGALDYTGNTNITFTTPIFTIAAATNTGTNIPTLNVTITSVVAPTTGYFQYGLTSAYGTNTPSVALSAGSHGVSITHPDYPKDIFYRFVAVSGLTTYNSSGTSFSPATAAKSFNLDQILQVVPLIIFVLVVLAAGVLSIFGWKHGNMIVVGLGLVFIAVLIILYPIIIAGIEGILAFIP